MYKFALLFLFPTLIFFNAVKGEAFVPRDGNVFYPLRLWEEEKFGFSFNFTSAPLTSTSKTIQFIVGTKRQCVFDIDVISLITDGKFLISLRGDARKFEGDAPQPVELTSENPLLEITYYNNTFTFGDKNVEMKCSLEAMIMDDYSKSIDVFVRMNGFKSGFDEFQIVWSPTISYYDYNRTLSTTTESTPSTTTFSASYSLEANTSNEPLMEATKTTPEPLPESSNIGLIIGSGVGGFILGSVIGFGTIAAYLLYKKNKDESDSETTQITPTTAQTTPTTTTDFTSGSTLTKN